MTSVHVWIWAGVAALAAAAIIVIYNGLVRARALAQEGWSGITIQLRRRADLTPSLVAAVEGYAAHERGLLAEVVQQRTAALNAATPQAAAEADLGLAGALGRLMVVAEAYPALKADGNFRALQDELAAIEDELQGARRYYNAAARDLNTRVASFPAILVAKPLGFSAQAYFEDGDPALAAAPAVRFGAKA